MVVKREIVKKKLERVGYLKWKKANEYLVEQLIVAKKTEVEIINLEAKLQKLEAQFELSQKYQAESLEKMALAQNVDVAAKMLTYTNQNEVVKKSIAEYESKIVSWNNLLLKEQKMVADLTKIEKTLGAEVIEKREMIDTLIQEWAELDKKIKIADEIEQENVSE